MWAQVINMFLGLLVMVSPALGDYTTEMSNNNYIVGPFIITFAMIAITDAARNVRLLNVLIGIWLMIAALLLDSGLTARINNMVLGILVVCFSLIKGKIKERFGGGWRSLFQKHPDHMKEEVEA